MKEALQGVHAHKYTKGEREEHKEEEEELHFINQRSGLPLMRRSNPQFQSPSLELAQGRLRRAENGRERGPKDEGKKRCLRLCQEQTQ